MSLSTSSEDDPGPVAGEEKDCICDGCKSRSVRKCNAIVYGLCLAGVETMAQSELGSRGWGQSGLELLRASWSMRFDSCIRVLSTHSRLVNSGQS